MIGDAHRPQELRRSPVLAGRTPLAAVADLRVRRRHVPRLTIAAIVTAGAAGLHVSARSGQRFLEQHVPADVLADARADAPEPDDVVAAGPPSLIDPDAPLPESTGDLIR